MGPDFLDSPEAIYRSLIEASDDFVFALDSEGKFIFANAKAIETFGNLIGKPFTIPIPPEYHNVVKKNFKRRVRGEKVGPYQIEVINKKGKRFWVEISGSPLVKDGKVIGAVYFEKDITERKQAEEALQESEEKFRTLAEESPNMIFINKKSRVVYANNKCEAIMGYTKEEFLSPDFDFFRLIAPESTDQVNASFKRHLKGEEIPPYEYSLITKEGKKIQTIITTKLIDYDGEKAILGIITDITEHTKAEESMKWQLMKFRIEKGNSYLVKETKPNVSLDVYLDLINCGFSGTILSRRRSEDIKEVFGEETEVFWIAEKTGEKIIAPDLEEIESLIEKLPRGNNVVILDRLDYLIVTNGFENTLRFIQRLNELFYLKKWVLLIALDPKILGKRELRLLENETNPVKPSHSLDLDEDIYEILKYVYKEEKEGRKPAYRDVGLECGITKQTTRKRIEILKGGGYLIDKKKGRYKILELTEKGKYLF